MDLRQLTPTLSVAPQIEVEDLDALRAAGFTTIIDNRPDEEVGDRLDSQSMRSAAEAAGLTFHYVPFQPGRLTEENVNAFADILAQANGPALAYCRSGTRSATLWAMTQAGQMGTEQILSTAADAGYDLSGIGPLLDNR